MRNIILLPAAFILSHLWAQSIVPNGGFETYSSCPTGPMQINLATGWYTACQTPDYFNVCGAAIVGVPNNWCGVQAARTGNAYGRVLDYGYAANYREYMQIQLSSAMVAGVTYLCEYYVNLNDNASIAHNGPEAYFSTTAISTATLFTYTPHIASAAIITDKVGWTLVSGTYTAVGGERYLTIGQYGNDASLTTVSGLGGAWASASYYIEDVSVVSSVLMSVFEGITAAPSGTANQINVKLSEPQVGTISIERSVDGNIWNRMEEQASDDHSVAYQFTDAQPMTRSWYRVRLTDMQGNAGYSPAREVLRVGATPELVAYPNPLSPGGTLTLLIPGEETISACTMYSLNSQKQVEVSFSQLQGKVFLPLPDDFSLSGLYLVRLRSESGQTWTTKVMVE